MSSRRASILAWLALLLLVLGAALLSWKIQAPISLEGGRGWDGVDYVGMATQLSRGERPQAHAPFVYRVGAPALAGWLDPADPLRGFRLLNGALVLALPLLLFGWLGNPSLGLRPAWRWGAAALFALQWHAPLRLVPFYPAHVDPLFWLFWLLALLGLERGRRVGESARAAGWTLFALLALPVREVLLLPLLAQVVQGAPLPWGAGSGRAWIRWLRQEMPRLRLLPVLAGVVVFLAIRSWAAPVDTYGFAKTALLWLWLKSLPQLLHGFAQAVGPGVLVFLLLRAKWRSARLSLADLAGRPDWLLILAAVLALGWVGGSDTERLLFWAAPFWLGLAARAGQELLPRMRKGASLWAWAICLAVLQAISQRLFWLIPDHPGSETLVLPLLTPPSSTGRYLDLWSQHAQPEVAVLSLFQYVMVVVVGLWWGARLIRIPAPDPSSSGAAPRG